MAVSLSKGGSVNITKDNAGLDSLKFCASWNVNKFDTGGKFDIDIVAFAVAANGKVTKEEDFVFFNQKLHPSGAIILGKDNRDGEGEGPDEEMDVIISKIPDTIQEIFFCTTIFSDHKFGMIDSSSVYIIDNTTGIELARFDLGEEFDMEVAVVTGKLYRYNGEWKFKAIGQGFVSGLTGLCETYGVAVS